MHFVDDLNPVLVWIGPIAPHWYGVMYALSFIIGYYLMCYLAPKRGVSLNSDSFAELILFLMAGILFGGRLGYVLFYNLPYYLHHPAQVVATWDGGMSFPGGLLGVIAAGLLFSWKSSISFWSLTELVVPIALPSADRRALRPVRCGEGSIM